MVLALTCCLMWFALRQHEPSYQGRSLTAWLADVRFAGTPGANLVAEDAIKAMGTNAIPFLMEMFRAEDTRPTFFAKVRAFVERHTGLTFGIVSAEEKHTRAAFGLHALGEAAQSAVAEISVGLTNHDYQKLSSLISDLRTVGTEALPFLLARIETAEQGEGMRLSTAIMAIVEVSPTSALSKLIRSLGSQDPSVRSSAMYFLERWNESEKMDEMALEPVIPLIVAGLQDKDLEIRRQFLLYVYRLGSSARKLTPSVEALLLDDYEPLRNLATNTLPVLQPK